MRSLVGRPILRPPALLEVATHRTVRSSRIDLVVGGATSRRLPAFGLNATELLDWRSIEQLRTPLIPHLGIDAALGEVDWSDHLDAWLETSKRTRIRLELRLEVPPDELPGPAALRKLGLATPNLARVLVVGRWPSLPTPVAVNAIRRALNERTSDVVVAMGTRGPFAVLNRAWPSVAGAAAVSFGIHPQWHADDALTIIENLESFGAIIRTARRVGHKKGVHISPITLSAPDHGVAAPRPEPFRAAWTLGSMAALAWGGADSATYHSLTGPHGIISESTGVLFSELGLLGRARLVPVRASRGHPVAALGLEAQGRRHVLLANLASAPCVAILREFGPRARAIELEPYAWTRVSEAR